MLGRLNRALERIVGLLIGLTLLWITLVLCVNVIARYVFGYSISWAEEMTSYSIIWITFLGCGLCVRKGLHVSVDAFVQLLPSKAFHLARIASSSIALIFALGLVVIGWSLTERVAASGQLTPAMMVPMKYAYAALPIGAGFMVLEYIESVWQLASKGPVQGVRDGEDLTV